MVLVSADPFEGLINPVTERVSPSGSVSLASTGMTVAIPIGVIAVSFAAIGGEPVLLSLNGGTFCPAVVVVVLTKSLAIFSNPLNIPEKNIAMPKPIIARTAIVMAMRFDANEPLGELTVILYKENAR